MVNTVFTQVFTTVCTISITLNCFFFSQTRLTCSRLWACWSRQYWDYFCHFSLMFELSQRNFFLLLLTTVSSMWLVLALVIALFFVHTGISSLFQFFFQGFLLMLKHRKVCTKWFPVYHSILDWFSDSFLAVSPKHIFIKFRLDSFVFFF